MAWTFRREDIRCDVGSFFFGAEILRSAVIYWFSAAVLEPTLVYAYIWGSLRPGDLHTKGGPKVAAGTPGTSAAKIVGPVLSCQHSTVQHMSQRIDHFVSGLDVPVHKV